MTRFLAWIAPRPGRHLLERPAGATYSDFHAPAASLGTACASPRQGAGRKRIAAGAMPLVRPAISLLPRPCPVTPPRIDCIIVQGLYVYALQNGFLAMPASVCTTAWPSVITPIPQHLLGSI